ncbi:Uncharacterised protein [Serratia rubidaea]|nr:Uncharacterised protein [Serratia rubidaea]
MGFPSFILNNGGKRFFRVSIGITVMGMVLFFAWPYIKMEFASSAYIPRKSG